MRPYFGLLLAVPFVLPGCENVPSSDAKKKPLVPATANTPTSSRPTGLGDKTERQTPEPEKGAKAQRVISLEAQLGAAGSMFGDVNYRVKKKGDTLIKEFDLELQNGKPGEVFAVMVDNVTVGQVKIESDGEADLELSNKPGETPFPANFPEPRAGSVIKVGDQIEAKLMDVLAAEKRNQE